MWPKNNRVVHWVEMWAMACVLLVLAPGALAETLRIEGTGDSQELLRELVRLYADQAGTETIIVSDSVGSGGGVRAVAHGKATLGRTARPLTPKERSEGLVEYLFARSPVVLAAHRSLDGVASLTSDQFIRLYAGSYANWSELGGPAEKIYLVNREDGDSSRAVIETYIKSFSQISPLGKTFYNTPDAAQAVAEHRYTVGYLPLAWAKSKNLHIIALDGVYPTEAAVNEEKYLWVTPFYIISKGAVSGTAKDFLEFLYSEPAQAHMREVGVVPVDRQKISSVP